MRIVAWNCNMALHRKLDALLALAPDVAVVCECATPERLRQKLGAAMPDEDPVWVGRNPDKGLAVFAFNGYRARLAADYRPTLRYVAPVHIEGRTAFNLLAVWAQNLGGGIYRKHQPGPVRLALGRYRGFLAEGPAVAAGDFNNSVYWDRPGWRINHATTVATLDGIGMVSAYHAVRGEPQGGETAPTLYWRDRRKNGPTYHIDYVFMPRSWLGAVRGVHVGTFEDWCGARLSDHVPVVVDVEP